VRFSTVSSIVAMMTMRSPSIEPVKRAGTSGPTVIG
jgi:hypothetical protein